MKISLDAQINPDYARFLPGNHLWHMDGTYEEVPPFATLFTPYRLSHTGGDTMFASTYAAYEGLPDEMKVAIRTLAEIGCEALLLTNAAGSLRLDMPPGSVMAITDHINFTGVNPLFDAGPGDSRFVDMVDAYDPALRQALLASADTVGVPCHQGVYIWFSGPSFETPAEIRAARALGADAVGMSTAPETILARHAGLKVAALSLMTNYAAGLGPGKLGHDQTIAVAKAAAADVQRLLHAFLERYV
jgi:inosine/guanosine/xanthosine phosphorylase family protein